MLARYRILEKIGSGGIGVVFRAEDVTLKRHVALKVLSERSFAHQQARARFLREARIAAALNHPNICTIHEVGEVRPGEEQTLETGERLEAGSSYLALELIEGRTLHDILTGGPLALEELLRIAVRVSEGLAEAHAKGVIHRDLKPQNVMVTPEGRVKILDFGLAKPLKPPERDDRVMTDAASASVELTFEGMVIGTVAYMSPEQAQGGPVDSRSDIFSFGILLYEMAAGKRPFWADTGTATLAKIIEAEPAPLSDARSDLPPELHRIVSRCLRKSPDQRYHDTRDLVVALKDLRQETTGAKVPRATSTVREAAAEPPPPTRGRGLRWAGVGFGALAVLVVAWVAWQGSRPGPAPAPRGSISAPPRQVTFDGRAVVPAVSPDGHSIAYVVPGEDRRTYRLMVQDLSGGVPLEIFRTSGAISRTRWSPDGSEILFAAWGPKHGTFLVPRLGGTPRPVTDWYPAGLCWAPDGSRFAAIPVYEKRIRIVDRGTGRTTDVALSGDFVWLDDMDWSPDGTRIVLQAIDAQERYALWTVELEGGRQHKILEQSFEIRSPRWAPGGDAIYYLAQMEQARDLWKVRLDPGSGGAAAATPVVTGLQVGDSFTLSADGRRLLYTRLAEHANLWFVSLEQKSPDGHLACRQVTRGTLTDNMPSVSPEGDRVAFCRGIGRTTNIFVVPLQGGPARQLTFGKAMAGGPVWSPDGREIAFGSDQGGRPRVWRVASGGGSPRPFEGTRLGLNSSGLCWVPGRRILYARPGDRDFHLLDPETEEEEPLLEGDAAGFVFQPRRSPDGGRVAVWWNRLPKQEETGLYLISLADGSHRQVLGGLAWPIGWAPDATCLYALRRHATPPAVVRVPCADGDAEVVGTLPFELCSRARMAPDGKGFVVSVYDFQSDVWVVEGFDPDQAPTPPAPAGD